MTETTRVKYASLKEVVPTISDHNEIGTNIKIWKNDVFIFTCNFLYETKRKFCHGLMLEKSIYT